MLSKHEISEKTNMMTKIEITAHTKMLIICMRMAGIAKPAIDKTHGTSNLRIAIIAHTTTSQMSKDSNQPKLKHPIIVTPVVAFSSVEHH